MEYFDLISLFEYIEKREGRHPLFLRSFSSEKTLLGICFELFEKQTSFSPKEGEPFGDTLIKKHTRYVSHTQFLHIQANYILNMDIFQVFST